jgi:hypothetical protein
MIGIPARHTTNSTTMGVSISTPLAIEQSNTLPEEAELERDLSKYGL